MMNFKIPHSSSTTLCLCTKDWLVRSPIGCTHFLIKAFQTGKNVFIQSLCCCAIVLSKIIIRATSWIKTGSPFALGNVRHVANIVIKIDILLADTNKDNGVIILCRSNTQKTAHHNLCAFWISGHVSFSFGFTRSASFFSLFFAHLMKGRRWLCYSGQYTYFFSWSSYLRRSSFVHSLISSCLHT